MLFRSFRIPLEKPARQASNRRTSHRVASNVDQEASHGDPHYLGKASGGRVGEFEWTAFSGNLLRRLVLPLAIQSWSLTSLQQRLFKTGGRLIRHARYFILHLAESHLTPTLFRQILGRIERLAWHPT